MPGYGIPEGPAKSGAAVAPSADDAGAASWQQQNREYSSSFFTAKIIIDLLE